MKKILLAIPALCLLCFGCSKCGWCGSGKEDNKMQTKQTSQAAQKSPSDREITAMVKASLLSDPMVGNSARPVCIKTQDGVVTLTGTVPSKKDREQIVKLTKKVEGVSRVDNQLTVTEQR